MDRTSRSSRALRRALASVALSVLSLAGAGAAEIYVLDAVLESDGVESISPTFIVTSGERALLAFDGERDLDIAMTLTPRTAAGGAGGETFDLRVELIDGVESSATTVPVSLAETETVELAGRTIKVLVRVQEPIEDSAPATTPAEGG